MDKSINNLVKMSFNLRNLTIFRKCLNVHNFQTLRSFSSSKETLPKSIYSDLGDNSSAILDYVYKYQDSLSGQNWIEALRKFSECYPDSSRRSKHLRDKKDVLMFCNELDKRIKILNLSQAEEAIQLLTELGISSKSIIFQSLLKNIKTMKIASSEEILQLDQDKIDANIYSLCSCLYEATNKKFMDKSIIRQTLHAISTYSSGNIPAPTAKSIFISCSKIPEIMLPEFAHLLRRIQDILIIEAHSFEFTKVLQILEGIEIALQEKNYGEEFYNKQLVDSMINKFILSDDLTLEKGLLLLTKLKHIGHIHKPFIDSLAFKIFEDPMLISRLKAKLLSKFLSGMMFSDYKPPFWESIEQLILDKVNSETYPTTNLILIAYNLAIMEFFPDNLISRVFQLPKKVLHKDIKFATFNRFVLLYQLVKTLHPNYAGPWPSENVFYNKYLDRLENTSPKRYPLLPALEKALGGSEYFKTKVKTKLHHLIDHVIIMRKGGFPVAINQRRGENHSNYEKEFVSFIEDIIIPPESQVVTIIMMDSGTYLRNSKQLRGHLRAMLTTLEALKYIVIPIYLPEWENLNERDKIPFIMNKIRLKCPTDFTSVNS